MSSSSGYLVISVYPLDLNAMQEKNLFSNSGEDNYNLDGGVEFWIGHRFKSRDAVCRVGGAYTCLALIMLQDHRQLDSSLICRVILPLIQSNPSISISVLQGVVRQNYHIKPSYRKICGDWEELYNKVPRLLQPLQSSCPGTMCEISVGRTMSGTSWCMIAACLIWYFGPYLPGGGFQVLQAVRLCRWNTSL
ncbi:hypothetical protein Ahy_A03g013220 [Arachis hypogaea]|uniref:Uncharacterized protein n=1 Tax=Arachis hypogaea TaxID=3818 RepID=A0A445DV02_ARAHY|nr:hypothetical protein Ahy_A03g013220 [Arachis hypogaea]